jgi:hypothetical protein
VAAAGGRTRRCVTAVPVARSNDGYTRPLRNVGQSMLEIHTVDGRRLASRRSGVQFPPLACRDGTYDSPHPSSHLHVVVPAFSVPLPCPSTRQLTASRGLTRPTRLARSPGLPQWIRPYQVGSQADSAGSIPVTRSIREKRCSTSEFGRISQAGRRSFTSETALVPLRVPLAILASAPGDCQYPS